MKNQRVDKILDYILKNCDNLSGAKIQALVAVIESVKNVLDVEREPNNMANIPQENELMEERPVDLKDIEGVQVDDGPVINTKIFKA